MTLRCWTMIGRAGLLALGVSTQALHADPDDGLPIDNLQTRVSAFETALSGGEFAAVLDFLPPLMLEDIAASQDMTVEALRAAVIVRSSVSIVSTACEIAVDISVTGSS